MRATHRLHEAVFRHNIMWSDLTARVAAYEGIDNDSAAKMVLPFMLKKRCSLAVAVALIDLIVEKTKP